MSIELAERIYEQLSQIRLIDPHTHINALKPASETLADILGYHYYTELAHSAGAQREVIEQPDLDPKEKVAVLFANTHNLDNTVQFSWFVEMARELFDFQEPTVDANNWESLYDRALELMQGENWTQTVMDKSKLDAVFLTNDFDDPLAGFDTNVFVPCLRTDDLVFHLNKESVQERLNNAVTVEISNAASLRKALSQLFDKFCSQGARACAISLPPDFAPMKISDRRADSAIAAVLSDGADVAENHKRAAANFVFWTLAEFCHEYELPFDLMIGVNRNVYPGGVHQGRDLFDSRVSLIQYRELFNAFPSVKFPVSVLASVTNQELVSYAWIFPNVYTHGHWWYSNIPTYVQQDATARLEALPRNKQIGYYSDMYKLEFALPKFNMYKQILSRILAERFVIDRRWSEEQAIALGKQNLRGNVEAIFLGNNPEEGFLLVD